MNPLKGEVGFTAGDQDYTLQFSINVFILLEDALDTDLPALIERLQSRPRLGFLRKVMWAAMQAHHKGITEEQVGEVIGLIHPAGASALIAEAMAKAFPAEDAKAPAGPRKAAPAKAGTGQSST